MDSDGAFLEELVAFLGETDAWTLDQRQEQAQAAEPSGGKLPYDANSAPSVPRAKRGRPANPQGGGAELAALRVQAEQLTAQLERLRLQKSAVAAHALLERQRRRRAEQECQALRDAVYRQTQFVRGLRAVVGATPPFPLTVDLCRHLHRHTRLPRDRAARWGDFDHDAHDRRIQSAVEMLCRETEALTLSAPTPPPASDPLVRCEPLDDVNCQSVTATTVYALDTGDVAAVARAACVAIRDVVAICPFGHPLDVSRDIVDADASRAGNALYRVMGVQHRCPHSGEQLVIESHVVTTYRITADHAVVLWDFVDDDECHPTPDTTNVTREITGACLIRRELCGDGVERTVFRSLSTKKFRFRDHSATKKLDKFVCIAQPVPMVRVDELLFRGIVLEQIAAEREALARVSRLVPT